MTATRRSNTLDMLGRSSTVPLDEALRLIGDKIPSSTPETETVSLEKGLDRITSETISASENIPTHPRSIMDGYAVRAGDTFGASDTLPAYLEVEGEVAMGAIPQNGPSSGGCYRIATGGMLPAGTDAVVKLEHTVRAGTGSIEVTVPVASGENVIQTGDDVGKGAPILPAGHRLRPQDLGLLAGLGVIRLSVFRRLRVGILSTGDEIVPFTETPPPGKVRDMNAVQLAAMIRRIGAEPESYGIVADTESTFELAIKAAIKECAMVIFSGSSSVGSRDLGERVVEKISPSGLILHGVAIRPGKPLMAAMVSGKPVFGLPGHPVSAAMAFTLFVAPVIARYSGLREIALPRFRTVEARLMRNLNSAAGRTDFVRVRLDLTGDHLPQAYPVLGRSGALSTMVRAHGFIVIPDKLQGLTSGEKVLVQLFD